MAGVWTRAAGLEARQDGARPPKAVAVGARKQAHQRPCLCGLPGAGQTPGAFSSSCDFSSWAAFVDLWRDSLWPVTGSYRPSW